MGMNPHANGGTLLKPLVLPEFRKYAVEVPKPGAVEAEATRVLGHYLAGRDQTATWTSVISGYSGRMRRPRIAWTLFMKSPARSGWPKVEPVDENLTVDGRVLEVLERAHVPRLAGRISADRTARFVQLLRRLHPHHRFHVQSTCEMAEGHEASTVASADRIVELSAVFARLAAGSQRIFASRPWAS